MSFALIESLNVLGNELDQAAKIIIESVENHPDREIILESADGVLGALAAKLRGGAKMTPADIEEYAQLYTSLNLLADANHRAAVNMDTSTPAGQQRMLNVLQNTGEQPSITAQVKKFAIVNGQRMLNNIKQTLTSFQQLDDAKKQNFINEINRLRITFERAKNSIASHQQKTGNQVAPTGNIPPKV